MTSRRKFLSAIPALGVASVQAIASARTTNKSTKKPIDTQEVLMEHGWQFSLDSGGAKSPAEFDSQGNAWKEISIPHTWQALGGNPDYVGTAWYRTQIHAPLEWQDRFVRIEFEAVFHTAHVFLNGRLIGQHIGKGYTAFQCDLSPGLEYARPNVLTVRVENSFSDTMLPRQKSFDWSNDGGIIRPVRLLISSRVFIERMEIDPVLEVEQGIANVAIRAVVRNTMSSDQSVNCTGFIQRHQAAGERHSIGEEEVRVPSSTVRTIRLDPVSISSPALWHFDSPDLYQAVITLNANDQHHMLGDTFGIRRFEARGAAFYLNGERVSLMGVERMAGSHPQFGMAEPTEWIESNHRDLKELNCVFTRVHWPQDKRVLDFCDRNGILMQEEIPAWGLFTFAGISDDLQQALEKNGLEQLRETIARDRNHPCIVSWGLCNEVDGKNPRSRAFANNLATEARTLDPARLLTYASHSLSKSPEKDMAGEFDFISTNEYFGSWTPGGAREVREHLEGIRKAFPGKPIVVSEYGWCECQPTMPPGDAHRVEIVNGHTEVFREFPEVAGAIYFDYNDYRTIVGDKGEGALRQRVHGVVDLYASRKPSFQALRLQASPIEDAKLNQSGTRFELQIITRKSLPAYTLREYTARWLFYGYDDLPMDGQVDRLPPLAPGSALTVYSKATTNAPKRVVVEIRNPGGFSVMTAQFQSALNPL